MSKDTMPCGCEGHYDYEYLCQYPALEKKFFQMQSLLYNLLARIFRDGGHRRDAIGDDTKAVEEADTVVANLNVSSDALDKAYTESSNLHRAVERSRKAYNDTLSLLDNERHLRSLAETEITVWKATLALERANVREEEREACARIAENNDDHETAHLIRSRLP